MFLPFRFASALISVWVAAGAVVPTQVSLQATSPPNLAWEARLSLPGFVEVPEFDKPANATGLATAALAAGGQWLIGGSLLLIGSAIAWGASHYGRQQQWQRIEFFKANRQSL